MIYIYFDLLLVIYIMYLVLYKKQDKVLLVACIPVGIILLLKYSTLKNYVSSAVSFYVFIVSTLLSVIFLVCFTIYGDKKDC